MSGIFDGLIIDHENRTVSTARQLAALHSVSMSSDRESETDDMTRGWEEKHNRRLVETHQEKRHLWERTSRRRNSPYTQRHVLCGKSREGASVPRMRSTRAGGSYRGSRCMT